MSSLSPEETLKIARFSRIELGEGHVQEMQAKFTSILDAFEVVSSVPTEGHVDLQSPRAWKDLRRDSVVEALGQDKAMSMAPQSHDGHFRVPAVL